MARTSCCAERPSSVYWLPGCSEEGEGGDAVRIPSLMDAIEFVKARPWGYCTIPKELTWRGSRHGRDGTQAVTGETSG